MEEKLLQVGTSVVPVRVEEHGRVVFLRNIRTANHFQT